MPDAIDQFTVGYSFPELKSGVGLSFIHQEKRGQTNLFILSGSYSQSFKNDMSFFVNGYMDFGKAQDYGAFVGFSMPLGKTMSASAGAAASKESWSADAEVSRPFGDKVGDYGWRVQHGEGDSRYTAASGAYRTTEGRGGGKSWSAKRQCHGQRGIHGSAVHGRRRPVSRPAHS